MARLRFISNSMGHCMMAIALEAIKCKARTRHGSTCQAFPVKGKKRCRMNGGARGTGAPLNNSNALNDGYYSRQTKTLRKAIYSALSQSKSLLEN